MSKFEEIDNSHLEAAKAEKVKFAINTVNNLEGCKIRDENTDQENLKAVRSHMIVATNEIAELQERLDILLFLEKHLDKSLTRRWLEELERVTNN